LVGLLGRVAFFVPFFIVAFFIAGFSVRVFALIPAFLFLSSFLVLLSLSIEALLGWRVSRPGRYS
jgi:hypothetical protein